PVERTGPAHRSASSGKEGRLHHAPRISALHDGYGGAALAGTRGVRPTRRRPADSHPPRAPAAGRSRGAATPRRAPDSRQDSADPLNPACAAHHDRGARPANEPTQKTGRAMNSEPTTIDSAGSEDSYPLKSTATLINVRLGLFLSAGQQRGL